MDIQEVLQPTFGKSILFRADKMHHSADYVYKDKRAITLFINIKKSEDASKSANGVIKNTDMDERM